MSTVSIIATFVDPEQGSRVEAVTDTGFAASFDMAPLASRAAATPTETVLAALAACASFDVVSILRKKRQRVVAYRIAVTGEKSDTHPKVYTSIVVEHQLVGDVDPEAARRSVELSATQYCPVSAMLSASVRIEHRYRVWAVEGQGEGVGAQVVVTGPGGAAVSPALTAGD
jgi:putative redox protein